MTSHGTFNERHFTPADFADVDPGPEVGDPGPAPETNTGDPRYRGLVSVDAFMASMRPPSYVLDGILQRGCLYSMTGRTGAGKTATLLRTAAAVALGRGEYLGIPRVRQGSVLFLAGENPDNVRMQYFGLAADLGLPDKLPVFFHDGAFGIEAAIDRIRADAARIRANPNISMRGLADKMGCSHHSAAERMVKKMKADGWVKDKGRGLVLTAQGDAIVDGH